MNSEITILGGDGIGPEVCAQAQLALAAVAKQFGHNFVFTQALIGGAAIDAVGDPLPPETLSACRTARAILLGAVGGPKWSDPNAAIRPEQGLLKLRKELGLFANLRPVVPHPKVLHRAPIKAELLTGVDIMVVRELTGGIYFGEKQRTATSASDLCSYQSFEIERIVRVAATLAMQRRRKLTQVDKANVLETSRLWRQVTEQVVRTEFPGLELEHMLVDSAAMHLLSRPRSFDVIVTENMFGDILTDEASMLAGSMGLLPSASINGSGGGVFEPIHGSAPDIAGRGIANPIAALLSAAMLLRTALGLPAEAAALERAIAQVLENGPYTPDLNGTATSAEVGAAVCAAL